MATNILVAFYSRTGNVEALAKAIGEGAESVGAVVRLRRAREIVGPEVIASVPGWADSAARQNAAYPAPTADDAEWADGIAFGTPTRFGNVSSELKAYIDSLGGLWFQGKLFNKAGSAFVSTQTTHGGNEATIVSLFNPLAHLGMVIVPNGYGDPSTFAAGTPYGASAAVNTQTKTAPDDADLAVARYAGKRLAQVAGLLKTLRGA